MYFVCSQWKELLNLNDEPQRFWKHVKYCDPQHHFGAINGSVPKEDPCNRE